jgi:uncharacterized membrane protein
LFFTKLAVQITYMSNFDFPLKKDNLRIILIGLVINIIGYIMMIGGGSDNPKEFNEAELFSDMRITVSPIVIVVGIALIIYGIMKKSKLNNQED